MITDDIKADIEKATVVLPNKGGQGVLIPGHFILTAAHCIDFKWEGEPLSILDCLLENVRTIKGQSFRVSLLAIDSLHDIAILGPATHDDLWQEATEFINFCEKIKPVPICQKELEAGMFFPVHVYTHKGTWTTGRAVESGENPRFLLVGFDEQLEGGTSGGPVINESGELVGIVSTASIGQSSCNGQVPRPHLILSVWVCREIFGPAEKEE